MNKTYKEIITTLNDAQSGRGQFITFNWAWPIKCEKSNEVLPKPKANFITYLNVDERH